ncbi:MAG TPA: DUF2520 domain-containing protein [Solirubrobacteraceae bacterium]|nr:DUF2520 domain-containing protein [Solirubrobacteraceae bacterium]
MNDIPPSRRIAVIGRGRLGSVLAAALDAGPPLARGEAIAPGTDVVILAVPDAALAALAAELTPGPLVGHCSGALSLDVLAPHVERFSLHPLMSLTAESGPAQLIGAGAAIAGSSPRALAIAGELAARAGLQQFTLGDEDRALYHAAASIASNFLVALESIADRLFSSVGVEHRHTAALARASLENWATLGGERALTGPIARGDNATVARQRQALAARAPDLLGLFDALAEATARLGAPA